MFFSGESFYEERTCMAKKKVYAVRKGRSTGIFDTWAACHDAVSGYPGAEFQGFSSKEEAERYLNGNKEQEPAACPVLTAYVDGSFDKSVGRYSFGCVLITPEGDIFRKSGNGNQPESLAIRNVAGEMLGAMFAVKWAWKNGFTEMELCYDYEGIEKWATGAWKAKNPLTIKYAEFMQRHASVIKIHFHKVAAHTGVMYNEEADRLAKEALAEADGIPEIKTEVRITKER